MTKASDNQFPSVLMVNTSNASVGTPAPWNAQRLFFDADGTLKRIDSSDTVTAVEGGGSITFGGVASTDTVSVASNFAVSDQGGGEARLDVFFPSSGSGTFVGAKVYNSAVQAISDSTATDLTFNSEDFDTDSIHSTVTNTARLTVPTGQGGKWFVWARTTIAAAASGAARLALYVNGSAASSAAGRVPIDPTDTASLTCEGVLDLSAGQYVTANIYQNSTASMDVGNGSTRIYQSEFGMYKIG